MKKSISVIIVVVLFFAVVAFAFADTKSELILKVQLLQETAKRMRLECVYELPKTVQDLNKARVKLQAIVSEEKKEVKKNKKGK